MSDQAYMQELEYWLEGDITPKYVKTKLDAIACAGSVRLGILMKSDAYTATFRADFNER